jgi:hypothetical protein
MLYSLEKVNGKGAAKSGWWKRLNHRTASSTGITTIAALPTFWRTTNLATHCVYILPVSFKSTTEVLSPPKNIKYLLFVRETDRVFCAVQTK